MHGLIGNGSCMGGPQGSQGSVEDSLWALEMSVGIIGTPGTRAPLGLSWEKSRACPMQARSVESSCALPLLMHRRFYPTSFPNRSRIVPKGLLRTGSNMKRDVMFGVPAGRLQKVRKTLFYHHLVQSMVEVLKFHDETLVHLMGYRIARTGELTGCPATPQYVIISQIVHGTIFALSLGWEFKVAHFLQQFRRKPSEHRAKHLVGGS